MSTLETHQAEQAEITARCEAGECDHPYCGMDFSEAAQQIVAEATGVDSDNRRRAARALLCFSPDYDDTPRDGLSDLLSDAMHLCDLAGWDFAEICGAARRSYMVEQHDLGVASDPALKRLIQEG